MGPTRWLSETVRRVSVRRHSTRVRVDLLEARLAALSDELDVLRQMIVDLGLGAPLDRADRAKLNDAHRLATETAKAVERLLQAEVMLWQAVDRHGLTGGTDAARVDN